MKSKLSYSICELIEDKDLKELSIDHLIEDNPKIYNNIIKHALTPQDEFIYNTILARSYALNNKYKEALLYYNKSEMISNNIEIDNLLISFFKLNHSISLGYLGKLNDNNFETIISPIISNLESEYIDDAIIYSINLADFSIYNRLRGLVYHIKNIEQLIKKYPHHINDKYIHLRLGVLYFMKYFYSNDLSDCQLALESFLYEIEFSDSSDYRNYWAKCGYIICSHQLRKKIDRSCLDNPPDGFRSRSINYPVIIYLIIKSKIILGDTNWVNSFLKREIENNINEQIHDFNNDIEYQNIVISKYKIVLEEWMYLIYQDYTQDRIDIEDSCKRFIKVNEIYRHRILGEKLNSKNVYKNNLSHILDSLESKKLGTSILYITNKFNSIGRRSLFLIIAIDIKTKKINIETCTGELFDDLKNKWKKIITTNEGNIKIEKFIDYLKRNTGLDKILNNNFITIPNSLFIDIPLNLISNYKNTFSYWPNLSIPVNKELTDDLDKSIEIIYDQNEKNSIDERKSVQKVCTNWNLQINEIYRNNNISQSNVIHIVCHFDGNNIIVGKDKINYEQFFKNIDSNNKLVVINMCKGNSQSIKNNIYNSLPLFLILKGVQTVICHSWDLGQKASLKFSRNFYDQLNKGFTITDSFNYSLNHLNEFKKIEYGGYVIWGNGNMKVENGS